MTSARTQCPECRGARVAPLNAILFAPNADFFRCEDCGYKFDVNYSGRSVGDDVEIPSVARGKEYAAFCPNCGLKVARENRNDPENDAASPAVQYGDLILVL